MPENTIGNNTNHVGTTPGINTATHHGIDIQTFIGAINQMDNSKIGTKLHLGKLTMIAKATKRYVLVISNTKI